MTYYSVSSIWSRGIYRLGYLIYGLNDQVNDTQNEGQAAVEALESELHSLITGLELNVDRLRVKECAFQLQAGHLLLEAIKVQKQELQHSSQRTGSQQNEMGSNGKSGSNGNQLFESHIDAVVKSLNDFLTTVGVVAALLLSISIPWILTPLDQSSILLATNTSDIRSPDEYVVQVNLAMLLLMVVSSSFSMLAIIVSFGLYGSLNMAVSDPLDRLWFIRTHSVFKCEIYILISVLSLCTSIVVGLYIVYGRIALAVACGIVGCLFAHYGMFVIRLMATTHHRLRAKFRAQIRDLRRGFDSLLQAEDTVREG